MKKKKRLPGGTLEEWCILGAFALGAYMIAGTIGLGLMLVFLTCCYVKGSN